MGCPLCRLLFGFNFAETPFLGGNGVFILLKPLLSDGLNVVSGCVGELLSVDVKPFYSELNLNQYSVGSPCRTICTVCGSPPCPDLNLIHYRMQAALDKTRDTRRAG